MSTARTFMTAIGAVALIGASATAWAQDWKAARAAGQIGEQPDGYLGIVGAATPALQALVSNVNIQRKAVYTKQSAATGSTVEAYALTAGCNLIANTGQGEKYRTPSGAWATRGAGPPQRDPRCV
jgi:uncharacterized protein